MDDLELFAWEPSTTEGAVAEPWIRWEDADAVVMDESGYFRELGHRLALVRASRVA